MQISFHNNFEKAFKKYIKTRKQAEAKFWDCIELFKEDPFNPKLKTHKLSGNMKGAWSFSIEYDIRVVFFFEEKQTKAIFFNIGSHADVY